MKKNNTGLLILGIVAGIILLLVLWVVSAYNGLVVSDETVNEKWANVQSAYQRRADLVPNLVATVKEYTDYEGEVLLEITRARASVGSAQTPAELQAAGDSLNSAIGRLLVVMENYPDLKANTQYLDLMAQLEGTENRIKTERDIYNQAVRDFNIRVRRFPTNMLAGMFGFSVKTGFAAEPGAETAPDVKGLFED
jgi:LemA protein